MRACIRAAKGIESVRGRSMPPSSAKQRLFICATLAYAASLAVTSQTAGQNRDNAPRFESNVLPIFQANCIPCHSNQPQKGLDLRTAEGALKGGESGPAIVPGSSARSLLFAKVSSGAMPMSGRKLTSEELEIIRRWIDAGALKQGEDAVGKQLSANQVSEREILVTILHVKCLVCHDRRNQEGNLE